LSGCFKEHLVIYKPKDIVSGDFYWLVQTNHPQTNEIYTFLAVIDCTGHGVPGALMSMIGYQLLDEIVKQMRILEPHLILNVLDELVISSLKQQTSDNSDGMDIAMCRLQHKANGSIELVYSGAKRDLIVLEDDQMQVIKGDRLGIGGFFEDIVKEFTHTKLVLKPNSLLYMNTDGIRDLPNPNRRSFGTKRLQALIKKNALLPLAEQKQIFEDAFDTFRGTQDARDDMTLVAVKL
jgi:serine phosphatase RsbU (regulator of sigma subunit)